MWSQKFEALAVRGDGRVVLHFAGQTDQVANLVVGANGTRSGMLPWSTAAT